MPHQRRIGASARLPQEVEAAEMPAGNEVEAAFPLTGGAGGSYKGDRKKADANAPAFLWSQQGMILRLPDYESGALTN